MTSFGRPSCLLALLFALMVCPWAAEAADPPAGIIMTVTGQTTPSLTPMQEILADTPIHLGAGSQLTFLHYLRCRLVTVTGGTVTLSRTDFKVDGHVDSERAGPCPTVHQLTGAGAGATPGGMVMRGTAAPPALPVKPDIIFVGRQAANVVGASVWREGGNRPLIALDISAPRASLPPGPPLTRNGRYVLRVKLRDQAAAMEMTFIARGGIDPLVVLRID